ncbi:MAG: hypothetical protein WAK01_09970 [Methylocystis sp.]
MTILSLGADPAEHTQQAEGVVSGSLQIGFSESEIQAFLKSGRSVLVYSGSFKGDQLG